MRFFFDSPCIRRAKANLNGSNSRKERNLYAFKTIIYRSET